MAFMMVLLVALLGIAVWAYFHTDPPGVPRRSLLAYNAALMACAVPIGFAVGYWLYHEGMAIKGDHGNGMIGYLSVMAGGTAFLLLVALGGMVRNFFVFPPGKRTVSTPASPPAGDQAAHRV